MIIFNQRIYGISNFLIPFRTGVCTYTAPVSLEIKSLATQTLKVSTIQELLNSPKTTTVQHEPNFIAVFDNFENSICSIIEPYFDCIFCYLDWQYRLALLYIRGLSGKVEKTYPTYTFTGNFDLSLSRMDFTVSNVSEKYNKFVEKLNDQV